MLNEYYNQCAENTKGSTGRFQCILNRLTEAWRDPKYDLDILLCFMHFTWVLCVAISTIYPDHWQSYAAHMASAHGGIWIWVFGGLILSIAHYLNIFIRRSIYRIPILGLSIIWGVGVSLGIMHEIGWNQASIIYAVIFIFMPSRKISHIIRESLREYKSIIDDGGRK